MNRIYLVDDHAIVRTGLRAVLESHGMTVVGESADVQVALVGIASLAPDIVVLDLGLEGRSGLELLSRLQQRRQATRVVVLTMSSQPHHLAEAWRLGATAYVLKGSHGRVLLDAVASAQRGERFLDPALDALADNLLGGVMPEDRLAQLSIREREVMLLVVNGQSSAAIGLLLNLSSKTVDTYRSRLMLKLGINDVTGLVRFAVREGVIDREAC